MYDFSSINPYIIKAGWMNKASAIPPGTDFGQRCVRWHEIELTTWGEGKITTEGVDIPTVKGNLYFRRPGMVVRGFAPYYCYLIVFDIIYDTEKAGAYNDPEIMNYNDASNTLEETQRIYGNFCGMNFPNCFRTTKYDELVGLFKKVYEEILYQKRNSDLHAKTLLLQILTTAFEDYTLQNAETEMTRSYKVNLPKIQAIKKFIDGNPSKWFTLAELAKYSGLSRNFFCRIFHDISGETPVEYMNKQKINTAKRLLVETDCSTKEIAIELGFSNDSYFYSLFKKNTGLTPTEFKQKQSIY
jgi:AraC-type DNA-binding domain-containing proteins